jgi:hypothetical protein
MPETTYFVLGERRAIETLASFRAVRDEQFADMRVIRVGVRKHDLVKQVFELFVRVFGELSFEG